MIVLACFNKICYKPAMALTPKTPKAHRAKRNMRPIGAPPVVYVKKKNSGSGGMVMGIILLALAAGGGFLYYNQQQNDAALDARQHQEEINAKVMAENERNFAEMERQKQERRSGGRKSATQQPNTAMGAVSQKPAASSPAPAVAADDEPQTPQLIEKKSAMGTTMVAADGSIEDTTPPPFNLKADGIVAKNVMEKLDKAIDAAADGDTFHDLQADLKRSFELTQPDIFTDKNVIPGYPDKEHKLLRLAQGVYVCLNLAAELNARNEVPDKAHAKFVNWLMKDKAKAARTFTYGLEHYNITDVETATVLLEELRAAHMKAPSSAMKKIPAIVKKGAAE